MPQRVSFEFASSGVRDEDLPVNEGFEAFETVDLDIPVADILASRMLREINLGLLVGEDKGGSIYRALVACARKKYSNEKLMEIFDIVLPREIKAVIKAKP